jgi:2-dehydropantoate 2-reductase
MVFRQAAVEYVNEMANSAAPIQSLIVTTKAQSILPAIHSIRHRLSPRSTIAFIHNGMGVYEQVTSELFKNAEERPHFVLGTMTHGAFSKSPYEVIHTTPSGLGQLRLGIVPDWRGRDFERTYWETDGKLQSGRLELSDIVRASLDEDPSGITSKQDYTTLYRTMKALTGLGALGTRWEPISDIQTALRQKLTANCIINPLTALLNLRNGEVFSIPNSKKILSQLSEEASAVFKKEAQAQGGDERVKFKVDPLLTPSKLANYTRDVARVTASNYSSMLVDFKRGSQTEIGYLNEYLVKLGTELGVPTPYHSMLSTLIRMKWHTGTAWKPAVR